MEALNRPEADDALRICDTTDTNIRIPVQYNLHHWQNNAMKIWRLYETEKTQITVCQKKKKSQRLSEGWCLCMKMPIFSEVSIHQTVFLGWSWVSGKYKNTKSDTFIPYAWPRSFYCPYFHLESHGKVLFHRKFMHAYFCILKAVLLNPIAVYLMASCPHAVAIFDEPVSQYNSFETTCVP